MKKIQERKLLLAISTWLKKKKEVHFFDDEDIIGSEIKKYGFFEHFQLRFCQQLIDQILDKNKKVFIDIGSNIGNHAIYFSKTFDEMFLFEPNPITRGILEANIWASKTANKKTEIFGLALSEAAGFATFYSRRPSENAELSNLGNSGLEKDFIGSDYDEITVETAKGDDVLLNKIKEKESVFIKIDAEGHEVQVFNGLTEIIELVRPVFWVEIGGPTIFDSIYKKLKTYGYDAYGIRAIGPKNRILRAILGFPYELSLIEKMDSRVYADVFFVPSTYNNKCNKIND